MRLRHTLSKLVHVTGARTPAPFGAQDFQVLRGSLCVSTTYRAFCWVTSEPSFLRTRRFRTMARKDNPWSRRTSIRAIVKRESRAAPFTMARKGRRGTLHDEEHRGCPVNARQTPL